MLQRCTALAARIEALGDRLGRWISWLTLAMVLITLTVALLRYLFNTGWIALQESVVFLHGTVFMLGIAYTLQQDRHVRVDIFYRRWGPRGRAWVDLLGVVLLLVPSCMFLLWISWDYVAASWQRLEGSREAGGLPGVFLLKTLIPLTALLVLLQGLANLLRSLRTLGWWSTNHD